MALNIDGTTGISGVDGSASAPALTGTDSNTGINFASDTVNINTGGTTRATVDSSGKVGIGKTDPVNNLDVVGCISATGNQLNTAYADGLYLGTSGGNAAITSGKANTSSYLPIVFRQDRQNAGIECMRILAGGGLTFNGDTATANALNDYEEGTFNAPYYEGGTLVTNADGRYTKIGNRVLISIFEFAYGGASNKDILYITGLPFAARSEPNSVGMICRYSGGNHQSLNASEACYIAQGGTQIKFEGNFPSGSGNWTLSLVYETDA